MQNEQIRFSDFYSELVNNQVFLLKNVLFILIFSIFNWFLEILKWKILVSFCKKISFKTAAIQSLSSLTASLITPNRIGEYGAKALYFEKPLRKKIVALNLIGNVFQLFVTIVFGLFGIGFFLQKFEIEMKNKYIMVLFLALVFLGLFFWFFLKKEISIKGYSLKKLKKSISKFPKKTALTIGLLSVGRYLIFSLQFYFLLLLFNVDISYLDAMIGVFSMYFISSIIPMLSLFDVILKSTVAIFIFSFYTVNEIDIISISLLMWIFNFVIPSIVGGYFVLTFNSEKRFNFDG